MTLLQHLIVYGLGLVFLTLITCIGTSLQDNLVFSQYELRFTAHGLAIKALDILFLMLLGTSVIMVVFKCDYMCVPTVASAIGMNAQSFLSTFTIIQQICYYLSMLCLLAWFIMMAIYTDHDQFLDYFLSRFLKIKGEK